MSAMLSSFVELPGVVAAARFVAQVSNLRYTVAQLSKLRYSVPYRL